MGGGSEVDQQLKMSIKQRKEQTQVVIKRNVQML